MESTMEQDEMKMGRKEGRGGKGEEGREEEEGRGRSEAAARLRQLDAQKGNIEGDVDVQYLGSRSQEGTHNITD